MTIGQEFIKLAKEEEESRAKRILKTVVPGVVGMGLGGVAAHALKEQLNKIQSPALKGMARGGLIIAAPIATSMIIPQVRDEWKKIVTEAVQKKPAQKKD